MNGRLAALSGALLAGLMACGVYAALGRAYAGPADARMSEYAETGEALVHGIHAKAKLVSYRLPLATIVAARLQYHAPPSPAAAAALYQAGLVLLVFALGALLHPLGGLFAAAAAAFLLRATTDFRFYPDSGYTLLVLLTACVLAWRARSPTPKRSLALALAVGATLLYRSPLAFFTPLLALYEWGVRRRFSFKAYRKHLLILCVVPYLLLLPWIALNWSAHRRFIPFEHRAANVNVVSGALGLVEDMEGDVSQLIDGRDAGSGADVLVWAAREVAGHPLRYARAVAARAAFAASFHPLVILLAAAALVLFRRRDEFVAVGLLAAYFLGIHCLMSVEERYFWPLWPLLAVLAASLAAAAKPRAALKPELASYRAAVAIVAAALVLVGCAGLYAEATVAVYAAGLRGGAWAQDELDRAVRRLPDDVWLRLERGKSALERGDASAAAEDLAAAARLDPSDARLPLLLAGARARAGKPFMLLHRRDGAREEAALRYDAGILKACALLRGRRAKEARALLKDALDGYLARNAVVRGEQGALGTEVQEKLRRSDTGFIARCLQLQGDAPEPERRALIEILAALLPRSSRPSLLTAELSARAGRRDEALRALSGAEALGLDAEGVLRAAALYRKLGRFSRANEILGPLAARRPADAATRLEAAELAAASGERARALQELAAAEKLAAGPDMLRRVVALYLRLKAPGRATSALEAAGAPWLDRAELAAQLGDEDAARAALTRALATPFGDGERLRLAAVCRRLDETSRAEELLAPLLKGRRDAGIDLERAEIAARLERRDEALAALAEAGSLTMTAPQRRRAAELYRDLGEYGRAEALLDALVAASPAEAGLRLAAAELAVARGRKERALLELDKAVALSPDTEERRRAARLYLRLHESEKAWALLGALAGDPQEAGLWLERAEFADKSGEKAKALDALAKATALELAPGERLRAAVLYRKLGERVRARTLLDAATAGDAGLSLERAELAVEDGDKSRALESLKRLAGLKPGEAQSRRAAALYAGLGADREAAALLDALARGRPDDAALAVERASARQRLGDASGALALLEPFLRGPDPSSALLLASARAQAALGRKDPALASLLRAEKTAGTDAAASLRVARAYQDVKEYARATAALDRLIAKSPADAELYGDRGLCRQLAGDSPGAISDLSRAVELSPDFLPAYLTLGAVYSSRGRAADARAVYERALRRPTTPANAALRALILKSRDEVR